MIEFHDLPGILQAKAVNTWLVEVARTYGFRVGHLVYNFVGVETITDINTRFLKHDYPTDIITFDYVEGRQLSGEIYLCEGVIRENAAGMAVKEEEELLRVMVHGVLHLMGFDDRTEEEKQRMRAEEEKCLILHRKNLRIK